MGHSISTRSTIDRNVKHVDIIPKSSKRHLFIPEEEENQFILLWLDETSNDNTLDCLRTKTLLREMNNDHCVFFNDSNLFLHEVDKLHSEHQKMLVIMSGSFAQTILANTQETISTIIIFCHNYSKYTDLVHRFSNVTDVCTDHETLKSCIQREIPSLKLNLFRNQSFQSKDAIMESGAYFSYILFVEILKQMPQTKQAKEIMLNKCKDYYRRNKQELEKIEHFRLHYSSDKAIDWYTEDCFVYRLVNQAFRTEDVALWYVFRYFIIDLCDQLETIHRKQNCQDYLTVYRGQTRLPVKEFDNLRSNIAGFISTNAFLSTSKKLDIAQQFILDAEDTDEFKVVLFEISVDAAQLKKTIFVDIDHYQGVEGESEVLFTIGSIFQIQSVEFDTKINAWKIRMNATDEGKDEMQRRLDIFRHKFQHGSINLLFGRLLLDMHQYTKAESYFQMMIRVLPRDHEDLALVYDHIGDLNMRITNWKEAYRYFTLALNQKKKRVRANHPSLAVTLNNIGNYYKAIGETAEAQEYYLKALKCTTDEQNAAITRLNIGKIYALDEDYENALEWCIEARDIFHQTEPCSQAQIIHCYGIFGDIYFAQKDYITAEHFFTTAFELSKRHRIMDDHERIRCVKAVADVYEKQNQHQQAIDFCLEQLVLYEAQLGEHHTSIAHLLLKLADFYSYDDQRKFDTIKRALDIFEKNVHSQYADTSVCLTAMAKYHIHRQHHEIADIYCLRALEIQKKIFPGDHQVIFETLSLMMSNAIGSSINST